MKKALFSKTCMALAAAAVFALGSGDVAAEPWGHGMYGNPGEGRHQLLEKLNLSADQKKKVGQIQDEQREAMKATVEQLRAEHEKMRDMMKGAATDAELREQHVKIRALRTVVGDARFESLLKIRALLSAGQRKRMGMMQHEGMGPDGMRHDGPGMKGPGEGKP